MGSGLVKCFVSNQSISEGAEVVVFPIVQTNGYDNVEIVKNDQILSVAAPNKTIVYANCFWTMMGVRLTGKAEDGAVQILDQTRENLISLLHFFQELHKSAYDTKAGKNTVHDLAVNIPEMFKDFLTTENKNSIFKEDFLKRIDWDKLSELFEKIQELTNENRIFVYGYGGPKVVKLAICLKSAYNYAIKNVEYPTSFLADPKNKFKELNSQNKHEQISTLFEYLKYPYQREVAIGYFQYMYSELENIESMKESEFIKKINSFEFIKDFANFQDFLNNIHINIQPIYGYYQDYQNEQGDAYLKLVKAVHKDVKAFLKKEGLLD